MQSDDRKLLEDAAKAAGVRYDIAASKPHPISGAFFGLWLEFDREPSEYDRRRWNPLTDDGDALRLAVKLRINLNFEEYDGSEYACAIHKDSTARQGYDEVIANDGLAATRRAIVRAAASLATPGIQT